MPNWESAGQSHYVSDASALVPNALAIDGSDYTNNAAGTNTTSTSLTTTESPDVIIVFVAVHSNITVTASVRDTFALTWTQRFAANFSTFDAQVFEFYAITSSPLPGDKIIVSISAIESFDIKAFGVAGVNTGSPFDFSPPVVNHGGAISPYVSVTTTNADDMILGLAYINGGPTVTPGSGFSCIGKDCGSFGSNPVAYAQESIVSSVQSGLHVSATLSASNNWVMIGDALVQDGVSTATSVSCSPGPVAISNSTTCTASVTGSSPTGIVTWATSGSGIFSSSTCNLSSGSCKVTYSPTSPGSHTITGTYSGDSANVPSFGTYALSVTLLATSTSVSCSSLTITLGASTTCTATVTGKSPSGNVNFTSSDTGATFTPTTCALSSGSCQVSFKPSVTGSPTVTAAYLGNTNDSRSSGNANITVQAAASSTTTTATATASNSSSVTTRATTTTTTTGPAPPISTNLIIAIVVAIVIIIVAVVSSLFIRNRSRR